MKIPIGGIDVDFPFATPYKSQKAMMYKIITALKRQQNVLIESPTGSGKTMSLLCASIAWQRQEYIRVEKEIEERRKMQLEAKFCPDVPMTSLTNLQAEKEPYYQNNMDDNDFKESTSTRSKLAQVTNEASKQIPENDLTDPKAYLLALQQARKKVPKIYFGSRTHKQLVQVVRELKRTSYCTQIKMTILGSRQQTCINDKFGDRDDKSQKCKELLKDKFGPSCTYYMGLKKYENHPRELRLNIEKQQKKEKIDPVGVWDLEELCDIGSKKRFCPYFALTGVLSLDADVIFCPYNYLIDPLVRKRMRLNVENNVILLDEAHNIEDVCRDACSFELTEQELLAEVASLNSLNEIIGNTENSDIPAASLNILAKMCSKLQHFLTTETSNVETLQTRQHGNYFKNWKSGDMVVLLRDKFDIEVDSLEKLLKSMNDVLAFDNENYRNNGENGRNPTQQLNPDDSGSILTICVEKILLFAQYVLRDTSKFMEDFVFGVNLETQPNVWRRSFGSTSNSPVKSIKIWCLNPAVAFGDVGPKAHSVILASGTLSPMDTFESELGMPFHLRLEAEHVLPHENMFIRSVGIGPGNRPLKAVRDNYDALQFQDELGELILRVCQTVPGGVLCFFASYDRIEKLFARWDATGLAKQLSRHKRVFKEPRVGSQLDEQLTLYYQAVLNPFEYGDQCTGALLLAVYRGKVSEGMDFADDHARAVITVGIPYPNFKTPEVEMKREYNTLWHNKRKLLTGSSWYNIQAYRALNQALGRCLRHDKDWGALLLVDERFRFQSNVNNLSKWIRESLQQSTDFDAMIDELDSFSRKMKGQNYDSMEDDVDYGVVKDLIEDESHIGENSMDNATSFSKSKYFDENNMDTLETSISSNTAAGPKRPRRTSNSSEEKNVDEILCRDSSENSNEENERINSSPVIMGRYCVKMAKKSPKKPRRTVIIDSSSE